MAQRLDIQTFIQKQDQQNLPVIDVRSPGEFEKGHFPGAHNIPLFDNEERAIVGTLYKQVGREEAYLKGLELVGPKMRSFVERAREIAPEGSLLTYCWRGGMRSSSMAWLWESSGLTVNTLEGGYKACRRWLLEGMKEEVRLHVLGGPTGSGKTVILHELARLGEQVIDLEGLANHKGSAFGAIGEEPQPSVEQFENLLWKALEAQDLSRPIWVEDESIHIGKVLIPKPFYRKMQESPVFVIEVPVDVRLDHLVEVYTGVSNDLLKGAIQRIRKRLGNENTIKAQEAVDHGDYRSAAAICLTYYDKTYGYGLTQKSKHLVKNLDLQSGDPTLSAQKLLDLAYEKQPK